MQYEQRRTAVALDKYPLWLDAVGQVLGRIGVDVVGKATSADDALRLIEELRPDVLVTEIRLNDGEMDGLTCLRRAVERVPGLKGIVLSAYDDVQHIDAALAAGAVAYVIKTVHPDDFASAIRQAFQHSIYMAGARVTAGTPQPAAADGAPALADAEAAGLTRRELEILQLVAEGHSNAQLAKMLWVTEQTVKFHLSNIYRKLDVSNRTEASRWAQVQGLLPAAASA
jgi:two-component system response regulator DevR